MLFGKAGEQIMMDLLLDCAIFTAIETGKGNLCQLSGVPISELQVLTAKPVDISPAPSLPDQRTSELSPTEIIFVKSRMMYARAALNARGLVQFGLRHIRKSSKSAALRLVYSPDKMF